ncbi:hypothetical protein TSUD_262570 [Trifolium subterraneum]|nr:hypothetical protein TSUD_262570 [Trifolium subterraneum]
MAEGANNVSMLYHETQEAKLCALHCINTLLQGPYFSEVELAAHASDLDYKERQMMNLAAQSSSSNFISHNVDLDGNFSIQVIQKALEVWDLQVIPLDSPVAEPAKIDPDLEKAYIFHPKDHWFCVRKVNGEWYNFNSLNAAPQHLSKSYLASRLSSLKGPEWSIFVVRGKFPAVFPTPSSEVSTGFGKWLSHEDAERINNSVRKAPRETVIESEDELDSDMECEMFSDSEDEDLNAAIAASLMDSSPVVTNAEASLQVETIEASLPPSGERKQDTSLDGDKSQSENQNKENTP